MSFDSIQIISFPFRLKKLNEVDKYMTQHNNQLPPKTDESIRAKLQEKHFGNFDKPLDFIRKEGGMDIIRGVAAFRDLTIVKDLKVNCNTARLLDDNNSYKIRYLEEPPTSVSASQEVSAGRTNGDSTAGDSAEGSAGGSAGGSSEEFLRAIAADVDEGPNRDSTGGSSGSFGGLDAASSGQFFDGSPISLTGGFSEGLSQSSNGGSSNDDPSGGFNVQFGGPTVASTQDFTGASNFIGGSAEGSNAGFNEGSPGVVDGGSPNTNGKRLNIVGHIIHRIGQAITDFSQKFYAV